MNKRQIQPITSWFPNSGEILIDTLILTDFYHYHFDEGSGKVSYSLSSFNFDTGLFTDCFSSSIDVPADIIQQWGADDEIIFNYVATTLGLIIVK
jgi:hypothetical protein